MLSDLRDVNVKLKIKSNPVIKCDFKWQVESITVIKNLLHLINFYEGSTSPLSKATAQISNLILLT